jgi:hypothetical protein
LVVQMVENWFQMLFPVNVGLVVQKPCICIESKCCRWQNWIQRENHTIQKTWVVRNWCE